VWDLDFSNDLGQTYLYAADGENNHVWLLLREDGRLLSKFARSGRYAGQLHWVHNMAVDSRGNIYTSEVDNAKRVQKFVYRASFPSTSGPRVHRKTMLDGLPVLMIWPTGVSLPVPGQIG
jgi:hypothetical protein